MVRSMVRSMVRLIYVYISKNKFSNFFPKFSFVNFNLVQAFLNRRIKPIDCFQNHAILLSHNHI